MSIPRSMLTGATRSRVAIILAALFCLTAASCKNGPVREVVSHKDDWKAAYIYAFPMAMNYDGSLTLYIQKDGPEADKKSNWLPAPDGPMYIAMRLYWPKTEPPSILPPEEGTWKPPAIIEVQ